MTCVKAADGKLITDKAGIIGRCAEYTKQAGRTGLMELYASRTNRPTVQITGDSTVPKISNG